MVEDHPPRRAIKARDGEGPDGGKVRDGSDGLA
jgi:hypothetical protein